MQKKKQKICKTYSIKNQRLIKTYETTPANQQAIQEHQNTERFRILRDTGWTASAPAHNCP